LPSSTVITIGSCRDKSPAAGAVTVEDASAKAAAAQRNIDGTAVMAGSP